MPSRPLNEMELASYDVVSPDIARRVRVHQVKYLPGGYDGMTLGRNILLAHPVANDGTSSLMVHELVHARQWSEMGIVGFAARYVSSFLKNLVEHKRWKLAYHNIDAELEAKRETTDWLRRRARDARNE